MNIRNLRKAAGLTQVELAQKTGISRMRLSLAECGYLQLCDEEHSVIKKAVVEKFEECSNQIRAAAGELSH